jgi:hypothetical protein
MTRLHNPDYIFVWDKKEQRVVASYYVAKSVGGRGRTTMAIQIPTRRTSSPR